MKTRRGSRLFNDSPRGKPRVAGMHYGTAKAARESVRRLRGKPSALKTQIAVTMYYRAKHHKYQTPGMRDAMKVWGKVLKDATKTRKVR